MEMPVNKLVRSIKHKSKHKIHYENIDKDLLILLNRVTNKVVKSYYKDVFLQFKDFTRKLAYLNMAA